MRVLVLLSAVSLWFATVHAARILVSFPLAAPSHYALGKRLTVELLARGHRVTFMNGFGERDLGVNYTDCLLSDVDQSFEHIRNKLLSFTSQWGSTQFFNMVQMMGAVNERFLNHTVTQQLIADKTQTFDLFVMEAFMNEAFLGFAHHFQVPAVIVSPLGTNILTDVYTKSPMPSAYVPDAFTGFSGRMRFIERLTNTVIGHIMDILYFCFHLPAEETLLRKYFPNSPSLAELIQRHATVVLVNSHPSFGVAKPLNPNAIEIGGYHLNEPKPLPDDLKAYADAATDGLILFSLGSNFQSVMLPKEILDALLKAFEQLAPYKVFFKFENETLPDKPDNVKISKWLPQNDLLAHPNMKLFITHGGLLSTTESIYHGVPIIGLPIFGDQSTNMAMAEKMGFGIQIPLLEVTFDKLMWSVRQVLENPKYRKNVRERSRLLRDQPMRPIDTAMYWIEYVLRHKSVEHLRTGALHLRWYQIELLDVYAALIAGMLLAILVPVWLIKKLCCNKFKTSTVNKKPKQKKQ